jgi:hypothetical protein
MARTENQSPKFKDLLSKSEQQRNSEEVSFAVEDARIQLEADIQAAKKNISSKQRNVVAAKSNSSFSSSRIITAQRELKLAEADLADLTALMSELF